MSREVEEIQMTMYHAYRKPGASASVEGTIASDERIDGKSIGAACCDGTDKVCYFAPMRNLVKPPEE